MKLSVRLCLGLSLLFFVWSAAVSVGRADDKAKRPNIIFIMADDK
jgi:hypothetical protein